MHFEACLAGRRGRVCMGTQAETVTHPHNNASAANLIILECLTRKGLSRRGIELQGHTAFSDSPGRKGHRPTIIATVNSSVSSPSLKLRGGAAPPPAAGHGGPRSLKVNAVGTVLNLKCKPITTRNGEKKRPHLDRAMPATSPRNHTRGHGPR